MIVTQYHHVLFDQEERQQATQRVVDHLKTLPPEVGIVCTGLSGITVSVLAADRTGRNLVILRRPEEECHSRYSIEGKTSDEWVVVDDFISGGRTVMGILDRMKEHEYGKCVGIILYKDPKMDEEELYGLNGRNPQMDTFPFGEQDLPIMR